MALRANKLGPQTSQAQSQPRQLATRRGGLTYAVQTLPAVQTLERMPEAYTVYRPVYEWVDAVALNKQLEARAKAMIKLEEQELATRTLVKVHVQREVGLGEAWKLVGQLPELGRFKPEVAPYMRWNNGHTWSYEGRLRPGRWVFKLVLRKADGAYVWEEGPDRIVEVPASGKPNSTVEIRINDVKLPG